MAETVDPRSSGLSGFWMNDDAWQVAWPAAIGFAILFHGFAFVAGKNAPDKAKPVPIAMSIAIPPPVIEPPPPPKPEPEPEKPKPKPKKEVEPIKEDLPPPPNEKPPDTPPVEDVKPVSGVTADSVVAESASGVQTRVGNTTFGDQNKEEFTPPQEVQRPTARPFDMAGYRKRVYELLDKEKRYPRKAKVLGLEGRCMVKMMVNRDGSLAGPPKLLKGSGHESLDQECLRMAAAITYPPLEGDVDPPITVSRAIQFTMLDP